MSGNRAGSADPNGVRKIKVKRKPKSKVRRKPKTKVRSKKK